VGGPLQVLWQALDATLSLALGVPRDWQHPLFTYFRDSERQKQWLSLPRAHLYVVCKMLLPRPLRCPRHRGGRSAAITTPDFVLAFE